MEIIEQMQSYEFVRSLFEISQCTDGPEIQWPLRDRMEQSSMDTVARMRVFSYNDILLRLSASWYQSTKLRRSTMNATEWKLYKSCIVIQSYRQSNDFRKRGMTVPESKPLPQTITVPEVQEQSTLRYIHQLRRLAVANAPGETLTSGLRERR